MISTNPTDIVMDFFAGSSTTAHAVMQLNSDDKNKRRFIMVQLPEACSEDSEAFKLGFRTICEIGEERIRRAGQKLRDDAGLIEGDIDIGFRVFRVDSSNMKDVYYNPNEVNQNLLENFVSNLKEDRSPLDLVFQIMLELGVELSANIKQNIIAEKNTFVINNNDIVACFDDGITEEVITELAKIKPVYAVFKDSSFSSDSSNINCEQIFKSISPSTIIKVI